MPSRRDVISVVIAWLACDSSQPRLVQSPVDSISIERSLTVDSMPTGYQH